MTNPPRFSVLFVATVVAVATAEPFVVDSFRDGTDGWRAQGTALRVSLSESDFDGDRMVRLDNSTGTTQAYLWKKAGPADVWLELSFAAKCGDPGGGKVGIHRYGGPIRWVEIGPEWRRVSGALRGREGTFVSYVIRGREDGPAVLVAVNGFDRDSGPVDLPLPGGGTVRATVAAHDVVIR